MHSISESIENITRMRNVMGSHSLELLHILGNGAAWLEGRSRKNDIGVFWRDVAAESIDVLVRLVRRLAPR